VVASSDVPTESRFTRTTVAQDFRTNDRLAERSCTELQGVAPNCTKLQLLLRKIVDSAEEELEACSSQLGSVETEKLRAVGGGHSQRFIRSVVCDATAGRLPVWGGADCAGLLQGEVRRIDSWPGNGCIPG
jgi:hypothetical protein